MKLKTLVFTGITSILLSGIGFASTYEIGKICKIQVKQSNNLAYISPCSVWSSVSGARDGWICWEMNTGLGEAMYTSAMAAFLGGKSVAVGIDENDTTYTLDHAIMIRIQENTGN
jgi:hypothetical protein